MSSSTSSSQQASKPKRNNVNNNTSGVRGNRGSGGGRGRGSRGRGGGRGGGGGGRGNSGWTSDNHTNDDNSSKQQQQQQQQQSQNQQRDSNSNPARKRNRNRNRKKIDKKNIHSKSQTESTSAGASKSTNIVAASSPPKPTEEEIRQQQQQKEHQAKLETLQEANDELKLTQTRFQTKIQSLESNIQTKLQTLTAFIQTTNTHVQNRTKFRANNLSSLRQNFVSSKKKLKTDLKKCTALSKKIKSTPHWDTSAIQSMKKDILSLNLTRYTEEIANAFMECKLKVVDVSNAVEVLMALHERYPDFLNLLLPQILLKFSASSSSSSSSSNNTGGKLTAEESKQKRIYLRLLLELYVNGVLLEAKPIMKVLMDAAGYNPSSAQSNRDNNDKTNNNNNNNNTNSKEQYNVTDANMIVSFAKASGHEVVGAISKSIMECMELLQMEIDKAQQEPQQEQKYFVCIDDECIEDEKHVIDNDNIDNGSDHEHHTSQSPSLQTQQNESVDLEIKETEEKITAVLKQIDHHKNKPIIASKGLLNQAKDVLQTIQDTLKERVSTPEISERFQKHLHGAYTSLCDTYMITHKKLAKLEKRCEQDRLLAGALSEEREKGLNDARKLMDTLCKSVETLSDTLNDEIPALIEEAEEEETKEEATGVEVYKNIDEKDSDLGPFDDEETKAFYCDIPDMLTTIPSALLGLSDEDIARKQGLNIQKYGSGFNNEAESTEDNTDLNDVTDNQEYVEEGDQEQKSGDVDTEKDSNENTDTPHFKLMVLLEEELPECNRIDKVDDLAEKFCTNHGTSKTSRKRMQKELFLVPRSRLDLLPYYSRIATIFDQVYSDIALPLVTELEKQFHGLARWKKQLNLENRLRNARYIGELTKFRVAPPIVVLRGIKRCLDDFSGFNIDVICCLLESCGRFLYRTPHTSSKVAQLIDTMKRLRKAKNLDERHLALLNSAFYMVQPPQSTQRRDVKVLSPLEAYTKDLLVFRLCTKDISIGQVSKQLLRYPWSDVDIDCGSLITKYLLKACRKGRYKSISAVALLISNMRKTKPEILTRIIDAVLEELQFSLEYPTFRDQQRSLIYAKLLGELYCQSLVSGSIIVDHLYNFLNFGHEIPATLLDKCNEDEEKQPEIIGGPRAITGVINEDEEMNQEDLDADEAVTTQPVNVSKYSKFDPRIPSQLDVESSVFRIKLVCTLLDSSASCLLYTGTISKLEKFMAAFQRYLFIKSNLPADIEFCILDTFDIIDSKLKRNKNQHMSSLRYKSWLEAHNSVVKAEELDAIAEIRSKKRVYAQAGVRVEGSEDGLVCEDLNDLGDDDISLNSHNNDSIEDSSLRSSGDESDESDDEAISIDDISNANEINDDDLYNHHDEDDDSYENGIHDEDVMHDEYMRKLEDEAFEKELRKLTMDALERGKNTARTAVSSKVSDNMPSASQFAGKKGLLQYADTSSNDAFALGGEAGMAFKLIKRGHKGRVESKNIIVPSDTNLAKVATKQDNEAARERDILKARVLHYEAESAVQAFSGDVYTDQPRLPENRNRQGLTMEDIDRNFGSSNPFQRRDRGGGGRGSSRTLWRS